MDSKRADRDRYCTPCFKDQKSIKSNIYCLDCESYFCDDCFSFHTRIPNLADQHIILRNEEIDVWKNIPYKCKTHNKCYEFFCEDHSEVCCQVCVYLKHRSCEHMKYIKENSDCQIFRKKNKRLLTKTDKQTNAVLSQIEKLERKRELNEASKLVAESCLKDFRSRMNEMLDHFETAADEQIQGRYHSNECALEKNGSKLEKMKTGLDDLTKQLSSSQTLDKGILPFICQKSGHKQVVDVEQDLLQMKKEMPQMEFRFVLDSKIENFFLSIVRIGDISDKHYNSVACSSDDVEDEVAVNQTGGNPPTTVSNPSTAQGHRYGKQPRANLRKKRHYRNFADAVTESAIEDDGRVGDVDDNKTYDDFENDVEEYVEDEEDYDSSDDRDELTYEDMTYCEDIPQTEDWTLKPLKATFKYICSNVYCSVLTNGLFCPECGSKCKEYATKAKR